MFWNLCVNFVCSGEISIWFGRQHNFVQSRFQQAGQEKQKMLNILHSVHPSHIYNNNKYSPLLLNLKPPIPIILLDEGRKLGGKLNTFCTNWLNCIEEYWLFCQFLWIPPSIQTKFHQKTEFSKKWNFSHRLKHREWHREKKLASSYMKYRYYTKLVKK